MAIRQGASAIFMTTLVVGFAGMCLWAALGMIEYLSGVALVAPLQNPDFPSGTQFIHRVLAASSGAVFVAGYALRWRHTACAMVLSFAMLATLCFVETFDFMTSDRRYVACLAECAAYLVVGACLLRSEWSARRFRMHPHDTPASQ